jgi:predicted esterase
MHGERDHIVNIDDGLNLASIFEDAGWNVIHLRHGKGHMVDLNQKDSLVDAIRIMSEGN